MKITVQIEVSDKAARLVKNAKGKIKAALESKEAQDFRQKAKICAERTAKKTAKVAKCAHDKVVKAAKECYEKAKDSENPHIKNLADAVDDVVYDINQICERDPAAINAFQVVAMYSGFHALVFHRAAHTLHTHKMPIMARYMSQYAKFLTGIEIHPAATIGRGLFIDHGTGVVIGETSVIGDNCTIYQGVTLGGTGKHVGKRHPTLGNNVMVGAGAKVLGPITVGDNSKIAAGAVVLKEIPENCTAVGIPAKVVVCDGKRVDQDLDQVHIPDPIALELADIQARLTALENRRRRTKKTENTQNAEEIAK